MQIRSPIATFALPGVLLGFDRYIRLYRCQQVMLMLSGITPAVSLFHLLRNANTGRLVLLLGLATIVNAQPTTKLMPETVEAFDQYVEAVEELMSLRYEGKKPFLWLDGQERTRARVIDEEIVTHQFKVDLGVPNGRLHDWVGAMFVSNVSVQQVLKIVQDYDRHKDVYPEVTASRQIDKEASASSSRREFAPPNPAEISLKTPNASRWSGTSRTWPAGFGWRVMCKRIWLEAGMNRPGLMMILRTPKSR